MSDLAVPAVATSWPRCTTLRTITPRTLDHQTNRHEIQRERHPDPVHEPQDPPDPQTNTKNSPIRASEMVDSENPQQPKTPGESL
jgi:hypothetical protein